MKKFTPGIHEIEYTLENKFFLDIDGPEVQKGKVKVYCTVKSTNSVFDMKFRIEGTVIVPCDRCLDDMDIPVQTENRLVVKFGKEYAEESDEIVIIPEEEGAINLAWFLYEFVALAIPMKHVHPPGKCNKAMSSKLKKHSAKSADEEDDGLDEEETNTDTDISIDDGSDGGGADPRWDALKDLI